MVVCVFNGHDFNRAANGMIGAGQKRLGQSPPRFQPIDKHLKQLIVGDRRDSIFSSSVYGTHAVEWRLRDLLPYRRNVSTQSGNALTPPSLVLRRAQLFEVAAIAFGPPRFADLAAVVNELVRERDPVILRNDPHQLLLDFLRRITFGEAEAAGNAEDVRVDDDAFGLVEADAKNNVGGLAGCAGNGDEFGESLRNLALEFGGYFFGGALNGFRLVMKKPCCPDQRFKLRQRCLRHGGGGREALEQLRSDHVDPDVRALGGKDGGDEQFPRCAMD